MISVLRENKNKIFVFDDTGEVFAPKYLNYKYDDYIKDGLEFFELMSAKPPLKETELEKMYNSDNYIAEEKLDGVRQSLLIQEEDSRIFSRRVSKATGWFCENTNLVPHLSRICSKIYKNTLLDGEFRIDGKGFKEVSSTMNCNWDLAIERQMELGFVTYHVFDIIFYKGVYIAKMPLEKRKQLLTKVIEDLNNPYIENVPYTFNNIKRLFDKDTPCVKLQQKQLDTFIKLYPNLYEVTGKIALTELQQGKYLSLNKKQWYEYIISNGGEGLMLKPIDGSYQHKRCREYTKVKKWSTWDCVICGFTPPTKQYEGGHIETWEYWEYIKNNKRKIHVGVDGRNLPDATPVSKNYAMNWIGNIEFGVYKVYTVEDFIKEFGEEGYSIMFDNEEIIQKKDKIYQLIKVGECTGLTDELREYFTNNRKDLMNKTVEIKAQELIDKKKGTLRHPDYLRLRPDKNPLDCTFDDHILNK